MSSTSPIKQEERPTGSTSPSVVSRLVNFVVKSSPIRFSTSNPNLGQYEGEDESTRPVEAVALDEDITLPTQKTLATLSVLEQDNAVLEANDESMLRRGASGDTIYYSLSDGNIISKDIPSVPVTMAAVSPSKNDISMDGPECERVELPESPLVRRQSGISREPESPLVRRQSGISNESLPQLASSSADRLEKLINNSPALLFRTTDAASTTPNQHRRSSIDRTSEELLRMVDPHGLAHFDAMVMTNTPQKTAPQPTEDPFSPLSKPTYSSRDIEQLKREFEERAEKHAEFLHFEIQTLQEKHDAALKSNHEMRTVLLEYERTMAQIIDARRSKTDSTHHGPEHLMAEKKQLESDIHTMQISFHNLHQRYEDMKHLYEQLKMQEQNMKQTISTLQAELATSERRYETLRKHAEERLDQASKEIAGLKEKYEDELSLAKAKLSKAEVRANTLENAVASKTKENAELMAICDELIQKIDRNKDSSSSHNKQQPLP